MRKLILSLLLSIVSYFGIGQNIGINSLGTAPAASAMLDIAASDKGVLIPRVDIVDLSTALPVIAPLTSLLVYNTNVSSGVGYYFWDGTKWTKLSDANSNSDHDWYEVGGTSSPDNINDNIFTQGKVGIGIVTTPTEKLKVVGNVEVDAYQQGSGNGIFFRDGFNSTNSPYNLSITTDTYDGGSSPDALSINGFEGVSISTGHNTNIQRRLTVVNNGNVGIGIVTPTYGLVLSNSKTTNVGAAYISAALNNSGKGLVIDAKSRQGTETNTALLQIDGGLAAGNSTVFWVNTSGNVGIGSTTPSEKLEIQGSIKVVDGTEGAGKGLFSDAAGKASWQNTVSNPTFVSPVFNTGQTVFSFNTNLTISAVWGNLRSQKAIVKLRVFFGANGTGYYYDTFAVTLRDSPQIIYASQMPTGGLLDTVVPGSWQVIAWY